MTNVLFIATFAGCVPEPEQAGEPLPPPDPPSAYIYDEGELPGPGSSLEDLGAALQIALDLTLTIHAAPVRAAYNKVMDSSTGACPYVYTTPEGSYWYDSCTASDGSAFDGYVFASEALGVVDPESGLILDYWSAYGGAVVEGPSGDTLELAGSALSVQGIGDSDGVEYRIYNTDVRGTFAWDGPEADGTWLSSGIAPDLTTNVVSLPSYDQSSIYLTGGFGGFRDGWAVAYDDNAIGGPLLGLPCAEEVSGTVGLRAADGVWYDIQFQGSDGADPDWDAAGCDGCGDVYLQGEPLGEVCVDFSTLVQSGVAPW